jgi:hypothetical protein
MSQLAFLKEIKQKTCLSDNKKRQEIPAALFCE